jgi:hypothetical protein
VVQNTGKALHAETCKPLNLPEQLNIEEKNGLPCALKDIRRQNVNSIDDKWRVDDEWWRQEPLSRLYYAVTLSSGQRSVIFKNLHDNHWYRQTY